MTVTTIEQLRVQLVEGDNRFSDIFSIFEQLPFETFEELKDSELLVMLQSVLTKEQVVLVEQLLSILPLIPYNESYNRRSYRAPQHMKLYSTRIINFIVHLRDHPPYDFYAVFQPGVTLNYDYTNGRYQFVTQDETPIISTQLFMYELAMKLNAKDARVEEFVREILWKNGAHPLYRRELIRGIMMSEHEEMHELLANVLLAAKNQEGVRQVITESIDEGSLKAQLAFMKVILEHDLLRFSSVVRAVDVWFGLGYDVSDRRQLEYVLKTSYAALQDESLTEPLLASASNLDVFIALWCIGSRDINGVLTRVEDLLTRETHVQQTVLYTLRNLGATSNVTQLVYPHLLKTTNVVTFLYGFQLVVYNIHYSSRYSEKKPTELVDEFFTNHPWLAEHAAQWLRQVELFIGEFSGDTYTIEKTPFTFISMTFSKLDLYKLQLMLALYLKDDDYIAALATDVKKQPVDCRSYFYEFAPAWTENVELLLPALKDRSSTVRFEAIKQLKHIQYPLDSMKPHITSLLMAKSGEMRMAVIGLLKVQPIAELEALATELLQHKKEQVRLGVLELLLTLKGALTTTDWTSHVPNPTEKERAYLQQLQETKSDFLCEPMEPIHYVVEPKIDSFFTFKDFIHYDFEQLKEKLQPLRALIEEHAKFAYASPYSPSELVGNYLIKDAAKLDMPGSIDELPLAEVWVKWLIDSDLTVNDI